MPASSACSGEVVRLHYNAPARHAQAKTRAQRGIRADGRLRRTPYRGFLRKPGDYLFRPVEYPRSVSVIEMFRQLRTISPQYLSVLTYVQ